MKILISLLTLAGYVASVRVNYQPVVSHPGGIGGIFRGSNSEIFVKGPEGSVITADFQSAGFQPQVDLQQNTAVQGQLLPPQQQSIAVTSNSESGTSYSNAGEGTQSAGFQPQVDLQQSTAVQGQLLPPQQQSIAVTSNPESGTPYSNSGEGTQSAVPLLEPQSISRSSSISGGIHSNTRVLDNRPLSQSTAAPSSVLPLGHSTIVVETSTPLTLVSQTNNGVAPRGFPLLLNARIDPYPPSIQQSSNLRLLVPPPPPPNLESVSSNSAVPYSVGYSGPSTLVSPTGTQPGVTISSNLRPSSETIIPANAVPSSAYRLATEVTSNRRIVSNIIPVSETYLNEISGSSNSPPINEQSYRLQPQQNENLDNIYTLRQPDSAQSRPRLIPRLQIANQNEISTQPATSNQRIESNITPVSEIYPNDIAGSSNSPSINEQIERNYRLHLQQNGDVDNVYTLRQSVPISTDTTQSRPRLIPKYQIVNQNEISSQPVSQNLQSRTDQISSGVINSDGTSTLAGRFQIVDSTQSGPSSRILPPPIPQNVRVETVQTPPRSNEGISVPTQRYQYVSNTQRVEPNLILSAPQNPNFQIQKSPSSITNNGEITVPVAQEQRNNNQPQELEDSRTSSGLFTPASNRRYSSSGLVNRGRNSASSSQRVEDNVAVEGTSSYTLADGRQVPYDDGQLSIQDGTSSSRPTINIDNRQLLVDPSRIPARNIIPPEIRLTPHRPTERGDAIARNGVLSTPRAPGLHSSKLRPNAPARNYFNAASSVSTNEAVTNINQNINVNLNQVQVPSSRTSAVVFPTVQTPAEVGNSGLAQRQQLSTYLESTQQSLGRVVNGEILSSQIRQQAVAPPLIRNEELSRSQLSQQSAPSLASTLQAEGTISNDGILSSQLRQQGVDPSQIIFSRVPLSAVTAVDSAGAVNANANSGGTYAETYDDTSAVLANRYGRRVVKTT